MPFPHKAQEDALVACGRHCCVCHKFCGLKIELHHIKQKAEGGEDTFENCIPLCFDCHADMRSYDHKHPKGTKYTPAELIRHRETWYAKVRASPGSAYSDASLEQDRQTFIAVVHLLPYKGIVSLFLTNGFTTPFRASVFTDFDRFVLENDNPAMEFLDADLEGMRVALVDKVNQFANYLASNTWRLSNSDVQSIPSEWEENQPERMKRVLTKIRTVSDDIAESYATFVREARKRLGINVPPAAA